MGALFSGPKLPEVQPAAAPPSRSDAEVQNAALLDRRRRRALSGRSSTNLTGDEGVTGTATTQRALLGGYSQPTGA